MPLIKLRMLDYAAQYSYAPPAVDALVNTDDVVSVVPCEARGSGPFVAITLRGLGDPIRCVGTPDDVLRLVREAATAAGPG